MHTEAEIRRAIKPLLDKYGQLNISEVKQRLGEVLVFDEDDKQLSKTRSEFLITQRIGNVVAHQTVPIKEYEEGYILDKNVTPAVFTAISGLSTNDKSTSTTPTIKPITNEEINKRKQQARRFRGRDVDWARKYDDNQEIGNMGEEFVYHYERDRVAGFSKNDVDRVQHLSKLQGDGLGYDISSIDSEGKILRIEVKTTSGPENSVFYMSINEKKFFEEYKDDGAVIYRVYNFDRISRRGEIKIITAEELLNDYDFDPVTFAVRKR